MNRTQTGMSELSLVESLQFPNAHLGHLTETQQASLAKFKEIAQEQKYYEPEGVKGRTVATHDDPTLLRYLRARKFHPEDAFKQFKDTEDWRKENHLVELYDTIDINEYEETRKMYPQWTGRRDRRGIPVYVYKVAHLDSKTVSKYEKMISKSTTTAHSEKKVSPRMLNLFALYENLTRFVLPLCSSLQDRPNLETPVTQSNNIVDISGVGLRQFWNLKAHMQDASTLATAYYPETLDRIFIIGAPSFFPTVWGWIKRWFDPMTVSKIFVLSQATMQSTLEQYIEPQNIPKKYGGTLDFEFGDMPNLDAAIQESFKWVKPETQKGSNTIPIGPIKWSEQEKSIDMVAVGSVDQSPRNEVIASTQADLHGVTGVHRTSSYGVAGAPKNVRNLGLQRTHTTDGTSTQPKEEGDLYYGADLQSSSNSGSTTPDKTVETDAPLQTKAEAENTTKVANGAPMAPAAAPGASPGNTVEPITEGSSGRTGEQPRVGTSGTRLQQQENTLAEGKLEEGTPAIVDHGHGDRTVTMEPMTVGQAPKEKTLPPLEPEAGPSLFQRAQAAAGAVYATGVAVAGKVGVVKTQEQVDKEKEEEEQRKREEAEQHKRDIDDPNVNNMSAEKVENFLRDGQVSKPSTVD